MATTSDSRVRVLAGFGSAIDLGGGTLSSKPSPALAAVLTLDGNGAFVSATQLPAGVGGFDEGVTVIGGMKYVKQESPDLIGFDPQNAKAGVANVFCTPAGKNLSVTVVESDGAGNAIVGGRYYVPGPTSGSLTVEIPHAFIFRAKIPESGLVR